MNIHAFSITSSTELEHVDIPRDEKKLRQEIGRDLTDGILAPVGPDLLIQPANLPGTATELAGLIAKGQDFLYNGHAPVRVAVEPTCLPKAIQVTEEAVRILAHKICRPCKFEKDKLVDAALSKDIADLYLYGLEGSWNLKRFDGITTSPILSDDGSLRVGSGYDPKSRLWCHNIPMVKVPDRPTREEAETSLRYLRFVFRTFPFADAAMHRDDQIGVDVVDRNEKIGLDESSFLAGLMTSACRASLELAPGYLAAAAQISGSGAGKGLLVRAMCMIGSGARPEAFTAGHDAGELDKRLTSALIEARPAVLLDNYNGRELKSDTLASALTEAPMMVRPMGHSKNVPLHTRTFVAVTGNGVQLAEDLARRFLLSMLDPRMEHPDARPFAPGYLDTIARIRPRILSAVLTIWRWGRLNKLALGRPFGSYEVWSQWCRDPLVALGCRDPGDRIAEIKAADPVRQRATSILDAWWTAHGDLLLKAADLDPSVIMQIDPKAAFRDETLQYSRQLVAAELAALAGIHIAGYALKKIPIGPPSKPTAHYKLTTA
jgi:hypothetical protein